MYQRCLFNEIRRTRWTIHADEWDRWDDDESTRLWTRFVEEDISYIVNSLGSLVVACRCGLWRGKELGGIITRNPWVVAQSGTLLAACKRLDTVARRSR